MMERFSKRAVPAAERPKAVYEYFVTGRGEFPLDMLRHDAAWPASGDQVSKINAYYFENDIGRRRASRSIKLRSYHAPTIERWSSFGWSVGFEAAMQFPYSD